MFQTLLLLTACSAAAAFPIDDSESRIDETIIEYVEALRNQGYVDLAIEALEMLKAKTSLSNAERGDVEFQIAGLYVEQARRAVDLVERESALDSAAKKFAQFGTSFPNHPRQGESQAELASIDLQRGRLRILQAQLPAFSARVQPLADEGRRLLSKAGEAFSRAHVLVSAERDRLPLPIDDDKANRAIRAARSRLFNKIAEARFQYGYAYFLLAESYRTVPPPDGKKEAWNAEYNKHILQAEKIFAAIAADYRSILVGPIGRVWEGRCLAARNEHRRARGIFDEILANKDKRLAPVHRQAFYFSLIASAAQEDFATVTSRGEDWIRGNPRARNSTEYAGVLFEMAKAHIQLGGAEDRDAKKSEHYIKANELFETVGKTANEFQGLARREQLRLEPMLARNSSAKSFQQLLSRAAARLNALQPTASAQEKKAEFAKAKELLNQAIESAKEGDAVYQARLQLAFAHFQIGEYQEAADAAEKEVRGSPRGPGAPQALSIALAALGMAFEESVGIQEGGAKAAARLESLARFAIETFGSSAAGDEAKLGLARLYTHARHRRLPTAVELLESVLPTSPRIGEVRSELGRVYLLSAEAKTRPEERAEAAKFRDQAFTSLKTASDALHNKERDRLDAVMLSTDGMLADLMLARGQSAEAWALLEPLAESLERGTVPQSVEPPLRLSTGLGALQAAIQAGKLEAADRLIAIVSKQQGQEKESNVTHSFFMLASRMRDQLEKLQLAGDVESGRKLEESYESFLDRLADRTSGQSAESYAFLGNAYIEMRRFEKAQTSIDRAIQLAEESGSKDSPAAQRARVASALCLSGRGKHEEAVEAIEALFRAAPQSQEVLFARGKILMSAKRLKEAEAHWVRIINGTSRNRPAHFYEALIQFAETQLLQSGPQRKPAIAKAKRNLKTVIDRPHPTLTPEYLDRLNRLLQRVEFESEG